MKNLKNFTIIGIIFVLITGSLAHFFYDWSHSCFLVGLFTPVNESVWEHMKLIFFPMLFYCIAAGFRLKSTYPCMFSSLCLGIITGTLLIPIFFYAYTYILGRDIFLFDIGTFILSTVIAFLTAYKFTLSCRAKPYAFLLCGFIIILFFCFMLFTYHAPALKIFADPTASSAVSFK